MKLSRHRGRLMGRLMGSTSVENSRKQWFCNFSLKIAEVDSWVDSCLGVDPWGRLTDCASQKILRANQPFVP